VPKFTIPDEVRPVFKALSNLDQDESKRLLQAVESARPNIAHLRRAIREAIPEERADVALVSLTSWREGQGVSPKEMAADIVRELGDDAARNDLTSPLSPRRITLGSKAFDNATEFPALCEAVRIFTDVRPVFTGEESESLTLGAAQIVHTLKVSYLSEGSDHDFFLSLDDDDLAALSRQIRRARAKATKIRELLAGSSTELIILPDARNEEEN